MGKLRKVYDFMKGFLPTVPIWGTLAYLSWVSPIQPARSQEITPEMLNPKRVERKVETAAEAFGIQDKLSRNLEGITSGIPEPEEMIFEPHTPNPKNLKRVEQKYFQYREVLEVAKVLFAEAGNQNRENRKLIARMIVNRLYTPGYQKTLWGVIHRDNSFSCTFDGSLQWKKANWQAHKNEYEEHEFQECLEDASAVMQHGWTSGRREEKDLMAYHDISMKKAPNDKYWNKLKPVMRIGRLVWYVERN